MSFYDLDPSVRLTEAEVRLILSRAATLEAEPRSITLGDLERAAAEAGISSGALRSAAREVLHHRTAAGANTRASPRHPLWTRVVPASLAGLVFGGLTRVLEEFVEPNLLIDVPFTVILIAVSLILASRVKEHDERPVAYSQILGLWVGNTAGWAIVAQQVTIDLVFGAGMLGLATAALAAVLMHFGISRSERHRAPDAT